MVLSNPVLLLNKSWVPVDVITVAKAVDKICTYRAKLIKIEDYSVHDFKSWIQLTALKDKPTLRTATLCLQIPEIIVLTNYNEIPTRRLVFNRGNIYRRDKYTCQYCGRKPGSEELTIDHILPRSRGGIGSWTNCVLSCLSCNKTKADKTIYEANMQLRNIPIRPKWSPRFVLAKVKMIPVTWEYFVNDAYWNTELREG